MFRFLRQLVTTIVALRSEIRAAVANHFATKAVTDVLKLQHAQELMVAPRNEWPLIRSKQMEEIKAVRDGQQYDIIDRRSWCCSEDMQILTRDGFKGPREISADDEVATLNPTTRELEYYHPKAIIRKKYKGEMIHFKGRGFDCLVTPNHRMLGQWKWINYTQGAGSNRKIERWRGFLKRLNPAEIRGKHGHCALSKLEFAEASAVADYLCSYKDSDYGFEVPFGAKWRGKFPDFYNKKTKKIHIECGYSVEHGRWDANYRPLDVDLHDYCAFLGIYIAEGSCAGNYQGVSRDVRQPLYVRAMAAAAEIGIPEYDRDRGYRVSVFQTRKSRHYGAIGKLLRRMPTEFVEDKENGWHSNSRTLHSHLYSCGNTYTKHVPQWVKDLPAEYLETFLVWFCKGDGTIAKNSGNVRFAFTVSKKLSEDLQELFLKTGKQSKVSNRKQEHRFFKNPERCAPKYTIEEHLGRFRGLPKPKKIQYDGLVWCVHVPPNGTIMVRRCGKAVWTGNSYPYLPEALHRL